MRRMIALIVLGVCLASGAAACGGGGSAGQQSGGPQGSGAQGASFAIDAQGFDFGALDRALAEISRYLGGVAR